MASGQYRTFDEFGWASGLSPSAQTAAVQSALNSGEPLLAPVGETVTTDAPLLMDYTTHLIGNGNSKFRTADPDIDMIVVRSDRSVIRGLDIDRTVSGSLTGAAIRVGPKPDGYFAIYDTLDDNQIGYNHKYGVHARKFGGLTVRGGMIAGKEAALRWDNEVVDTGDSKIIGVDINANNDIGVGLYWTAGGGVYVTNCKFNQGYHHVKIDNSLGNTGSIMIQGNSLEGNTPISIDIMGASYFNRMHIQNNSIGVLGCAIAVRNFNPLGGTATPWLNGLMIDGNTIEAGFNGSPLMDIGCATNPVIGQNTYHARGGGAGIILRAPCTGALVDTSGAKFIGCSPNIVQAGDSGTVFY